MSLYPFLLLSAFFPPQLSFLPSSDDCSKYWPTSRRSGTYSFPAVAAAIGYGRSSCGTGKRKRPGEAGRFQFFFFACLDIVFIHQDDVFILIFTHFLILVIISLYYAIYPPFCQLPSWRFSHKGTKTQIKYLFKKLRAFVSCRLISQASITLPFIEISPCIQIIFKFLSYH